MNAQHISAERINALLPQTQCTQCGFQGCLPYAQALAAGEAAINRCPPGGAAGIAKLAALLHQTVLPLDPKCGVEAPRRVAFIVEELCIGCTKCIQACPVDAIVGAAKFMHTVLADDCTGCRLCVAPCPVDCIEMRELLPSNAPVAAWTQSDADTARRRYEARQQRLVREQQENDARLQALALQKLAHFEAIKNPSAEEQRKRAVVQAAIERARLKKQSPTQNPAPAPKHSTPSSTST